MPNTGTVIPDGLNLRGTAGGAILRVLPKGTRVDVIEDLGDFLKVKAFGQTGFVKASLINRLLSSGDGFHFENGKAVAPDGTVFGTKFKLGIFNFGETSIRSFVGANPQAFPNLSQSRLRVMSAVSANEGRLEAINTWDSAFLTFGCFQWTVGADNAAGELPAMVNQLKQSDAAAFEELLGQFGLDIDSVSSPAGSTPTGFFSLHGKPVKSAADKEAKLRTLEMAFRFFKAGQDQRLRVVEVEYAAARIDLFYRDPNHLIKKRFIGDYVSSEFGVALVLDEHVNRPAHVPRTLSGAVDEFIAATGKTDPATWTDADEAGLLNLYIQRRSTSGMTDSDKRAKAVRDAVAAGLASAARGSFQP